MTPAAATRKLMRLFGALDDSMPDAREALVPLVTTTADDPDAQTIQASVLTQGHGETARHTNQQVHATGEAAHESGKPGRSCVEQSGRNQDKGQRGSHAVGAYAGAVEPC
jgi:hypothetical protein